MTNTEIISAFVDGEPVDAAQLTHTLAEPEGRQCLLDILRLQALVAETEGNVALLDPRGAIVERRAAIGQARRAPGRWLLAAGALLIVGLGAFAAGVQLGQRDGSSFVATAQPPEPQRVIELREGIEWKNTAGGI